MHIRLIALSILAIIATMILAEEKKDRDEIELRVYDARDIVNSITDYPAPFLTMRGLRINTDQSLANSFMPAHHQPTLTSSDLVDVIKTRLLPLEFAPMETSLEESFGYLIVNQRPKVHELIGEIIRNIRNMVKPQIAVKAFLVSAAEAPEATYFDEECLEKVLRAGTILASSRLVCNCMQRVHSVSGREIAYVWDYDIVGNNYDPSVSAILDGSVFDVRPTLSSDSNFVELNISFMQNANVVKRLQSLGLATPSAAVVAPLKASSTQIKDEKGVVIGDQQDAKSLLGGQYIIRAEFDLLSVDTNCVKTQVVVPAGKWALAAVMNNRDPKIKEKHLLLFVSAEVLNKNASTQNAF
ncbi:MAG: hypothetical protein V1899_06875 [Planctomycetota bacterium]